MEDFEARFWGNCVNTYGEETKQLLYMREMGFPIVKTWRSSFTFDMGGRSAIDIGGGPCSVLLKCENLHPGRRSSVVDPANYPTWVENRYFAAGINYVSWKGEDHVSLKDEDLLGLGAFDLALIYNVLQHVDDPALVVAAAIAAAKELRMFEWIDLPPHEGHPHMLTAANLEGWTGRRGRILELHGENECTGRAWVLGAP